MNMKQIGLLSALAALSVGAAAISMGSGPQGFASDKRGQLVFPGLTQKANDVTSITIRDFERSFTVERRDDDGAGRESVHAQRPVPWRNSLARRCIESLPGLVCSKANCLTVCQQNAYR